MREVTILADDLTGALDSAAAFAAPGAEVEVGWQVAPGRRIAIDTESRGLTADASRRLVAGLMPALADSRLAFKKIDSLLRGASFAEIAACAQAVRFDAVIVAPAFPQQGRTTVGGMMRPGPAAGPEVSILEGLAAAGVAAASVAAGEPPLRCGVSVCDATTPQHLDALVRATGAEARAVLWCGSAGLAYALAGEGAAAATCRASLAILGSRHRVTRDSARALRRPLGSGCVELTSPEGVETAVAALRAALRERRRAALVFDLPAMEPEAAEALYRAALARLVRASPAPDHVIVVGGDTLFRLAGAAEARSLAALGHRSPGLPVSRIRGGLWDGTVLTSKSGAFSDAGLFADFAGEELKRA